MSPHRLKRSAFAVLLALGAASAQAAVVLNEGFSSVAGLAGAGWVMTNVGAGGTTSWFQGDAGVFAAQGGANDSYIAANYNNSAAGAPIQNWLISPLFNYTQVSTLEFFTRTDGSTYADRLQVRYSTGGTSLSDFSTALFSINGAELAGGYPTDWTAFSAVLAGGPGRVAFVYDVSNSDNANYIGIDSVSLVSAIPEPASMALVGLALAGAAFGTRRAARKSAA